MVIDAMIGDDACGTKMTSLVETRIASLDGRKIIFAKPQTFMNLCGRAVRFLVDFYKIDLENVYVFHDDIDLGFGAVKIKKGGGSGGHNGLKSIDSLVGNNYWRIRIGIGRPQEKSMVSSYVLHNFEDDQRNVIAEICAEISKNIQLLISDSKKLEASLNLIGRKNRESGNIDGIKGQGDQPIA
jgi:PTH1 family peptidyl-tRNA hydrolase